MFSIGIMEGKDRPIQIGRKEYYEEGGTSLLLLRLAKSLFGTGKLVILDIVFCVSKSIVLLKKRIFYASVLIKNVAIGLNILMGPSFKTL